MRKYRLHWSVHPDKDMAWYTREKKRRSEDAVARELDINYSLSVSGKVFSPYRQARHVSKEPLKIIRGTPVYRIWDFGKTYCTMYAQVDVYNRKRIHLTRVEEGSNVKGQIRQAELDSADFFPGCEFLDICDPAGQYDDYRGNNPDVEALEREGVYPEYDRIDELPTKERKSRGIGMIMRDLQETPGGQEAFQMYVPEEGDGGCHVLKRAFEGGYRYKTDVNNNILTRILEVHPYEDVIDCLIYFYLQTSGMSGVDESMYEPVMPTGKNPYTGY